VAAVGSRRRRGWAAAGRSAIYSADFYARVDDDDDVGGGGGEFGAWHAQMGPPVVGPSVCQALSHAAGILARRRYRHLRSQFSAVND